MLRLRKIEPNDFESFQIDSVKPLSQVDTLALEYVGIALVENYDNEYNEYEYDSMDNLADLFIFQNEQLYTIDDGILGYDTDSKKLLVLNRIYVTHRNQVILEVHNLTNSFINENIECDGISSYNEAIVENMNNLEFHMDQNEYFDYYLVTV